MGHSIGHRGTAPRGSISTAQSPDLTWTRSPPLSTPRIGSTLPIGDDLAYLRTALELPRLDHGSRSTLTRARTRLAARIARRSSSVKSPTSTHVVMTSCVAPQRTDAATGVGHPQTVLRAIEPTRLIRAKTTERYRFSRPSPVHRARPQWRHLGASTSLRSPGGERPRLRSRSNSTAGTIALAVGASANGAIGLPREES